MTITNVERLHEAIIAAGVAIVGVNAEGIVSPDTLQAAAQPTINAFDDSPEAHATWLAQKEKTEATSAVDDAFTKTGNRVERIVMSVATSAIKVINNDRITLGQMNAAVQAATSLADLKTRFAAISFPAQITNQQLINSIKADIASTPE